LDRKKKKRKNEKKKKRKEEKKKRRKEEARKSDERKEGNFHIAGQGGLLLSISWTARPA
jgi:hypothetical protein